MKNTQTKVISNRSRSTGELQLQMVNKEDAAIIKPADRKELHTAITVKTDAGKIEKITIRGEHVRHSHCSADHNSKAGDRVFWYKDTHYSWPKVEGIVVSAETYYWDYSKPIGHRRQPLD